MYHSTTGHWPADVPANNIDACRPEGACVRYSSGQRKSAESNESEAFFHSLPAIGVSDFSAAAVAL